MQDKIKSLMPENIHVIIEQGTEPPNSGKHLEENSFGTYLCRRCGKALFRSSSKFTSSCGWPSFDDEIKGSIDRIPDQDGRRTEIRCMRCKSHLGHVFMGEQLTQKNLRHCVNSLSIDFCNSQTVLDTRELIVAGGCFWGIDHYMKNEHGVVFSETGYTHGSTAYPTYKDICLGKSNHFEAVRIIFDIDLTDEEKLLKRFFEIHDPTQKDGQGNDVGNQYQSAVFYYDAYQKNICQQLLNILKENGFDAATELIPATVFWPAEVEHQNYLINNPNGYCNHSYVKRFN